MTNAPPGFKQLTLEENLEHLVDHAGLYSVAEALEKICHEKAEHVRANWQDNVSAKNWERAGKAFGALVAKLYRISGVKPSGAF